MTNTPQCAEEVLPEHSCALPEHGFFEDCRALFSADQVIMLQDVREGEALEDVRERIVMEVNEGRLSPEAANVVLAALDMEEVNA